ncbi:MAG: hypothetical protein ACJ797_25070 [Ktedonobacteraceae bacterium]
MSTTEEKSRQQSIAALSPSLPWYLLTPEERQLILDYLIKVLEKEVKQEERQLVLVKS